MERIWNLRLNMDTFNGAYMKLRSDSERLEYFLGWHLGCLGGDVSEDDSKAFQAGFSVGRGMLDEAKEFAEKQAERGRASAESRRAKSGTAQPSRTSSRTEDRTSSEPAFGNSSNQSTIHNPQSTIQQTKKPKTTHSSEVIASAESRRNRTSTAVQPQFNHGSTMVQPDINQTSTYPTTNNQQPTTNNEQPKKARQAAFVPPSESEWVEYCTRTWSDWHPVCAGDAWAYYEGVGWVVGRKPCRDWKATARTAHGNARQWGKLQPQNQQWTPQAVTPIVCRPGELDGIDLASIGRL